MATIEQFEFIFNNYEKIPTVHLSNITFGRNRNLIPKINNKELYSITNCYFGKGRLILKLGGNFEDKEMLVIQHPLVDKSNKNIISILYESIKN